MFVSSPQLIPSLINCLRACRTNTRRDNISPKKGHHKREERKEEQRSMVSREQKSAAALHEKLQLLRSITNSHSQSKTSIISDASKYIVDLKQKVERLNQDIETAQSSNDENELPVQVTVETLEKGLLINVFSERSCPGLLVFILEAFEDLSLNVLEARVSCTESFRLQALGEEGEESEGIDAYMVKQVVSQAIRSWSESYEQE